MKRNVDKDIRESLAKKHACYVLITCDVPADDGNMQVEMSYEGDATLAAYLLQGAQTFIEDQAEEIIELPPCKKEKIQYIE